MPNGHGITPADLAQATADTARKDAQSNADKFERLVMLLMAKGVITPQEWELFDA